MSNLNSRELVEWFKAGQDEAATAIFDRYIQRLIALARGRIGTKLKRRIDPDDVVQSAYRSFFVHAKNEEYLLDRSGDLWRLLAGITLNKIRGQIEKQTAAKRTIHREASHDNSIAAAITNCPTPAEAVAVIELLALALKSLSTDERLVITATLQGQSIEEIAETIGKSERTARRILASARAMFEQRLLTDTPPAPTFNQNVESSAFEPHASLRYSNYALEQLLGTGGMGKVYRAGDTTSGRTVAVKALHKARQTDERAVRQFMQEAQILTNLHHPNIVSVHGLGRFPGGGYFIVMDFVDGTDLQDQLLTGPLAFSDAVRIIGEVAKAVQYANEKGVVHCDLKPGNVLIDRSKRVTVTDFGFAYMIADNSTEVSQAIGGTAGYVAPEVLWRGQAPTKASDIYGLGALLWALCVGTPASDVSRLNDQKVPTAISALCARCLAVDPKQRYQTATQFIHDLNLQCVD